MEKPKIPKLLWAIIIFAFLVNLVTIAVALRSPSGSSYPNTTQQVAQVDYNRIDSIVSRHISALNLQDGLNGVNGINGKNGLNGTDGRSIQGSQGVQGEQGQQGDPGPAGPTIELRYNTVKTQIEWRYNGDFTWNKLVSACTLTNTCP